MGERLPAELGVATVTGIAEAPGGGWVDVGRDGARPTLCGAGVAVAAGLGVAVAGGGHTPAADAGAE